MKTSMMKYNHGDNEEAENKDDVDDFDRFWSRTWADVEGRTGSATTGASSASAGRRTSERTISWSITCVEVNRGTGSASANTSRGTGTG